MKIKPLDEYKKESLTVNLPIPVTQSMKDRYRQVDGMLKRVDKGVKLHDITRNELERILTEVETRLSEYLSDKSA